ncbi:hypothetical protein CCR83_01280 [Rhodobacter veldkampii DSM 11550]|uniref:Glycosyl transferase family 1 n=1 Tax=Phaeovulum veldkampii DSM 11550 TaxID=1185920 RepID=A0A2T4JFR2_9RHOB|nr:ABC transporter ATP-binding protein/permease [Phaeovulum veldkampii]MBK5945111.1 hypothetical protein [Phaeovulum veldkampii DSM 11550]PTE16752.1 glycosyl transferase family 1 [Phaeovulum veldkampii DSM 11550]TDQ64562.1 putative ATP-binding cassette transporter [Phaeovulum veldkampii DSM 11550]
MPIDNSDTSKARAAVGRSVPGTALWLLRRLRRGAPRQARLIALMLAAVFAVVLANTFGQVRLNQWQGAFYNALERRNLPDFVAEIGVFFVIVAGLLTLGVAQTWIDATLKVKARAWVTDHVLSAWLQPRRAYLLGFSGEIARNPDQRISQDAARLTDLTIAFTIGLGQASLLLVSFLGVLWTLSAEVVFSWRGESFTIPGYMVWCALAFTLIGSVLTWAVGRPLVARNAETFAREGVFRTELVRISENAKVITLEGGEAGERAQTGRALGHLVVALQMLANARARLTWITAGYGWIGLVFPILVAAPGYFAGNMTLGSLMMVVGAFNQVQNSLRWFIDNYPGIAEWQAALQRVSALLVSLDALDADHDPAPRIEADAATTDRLVLDRLAVRLPDGGQGCVTLSEPRVEIAPAERVLILGAPGSGKTTLFMALAGLWPWGQGRILRPAGFRAMFLCEQPYIPDGTLIHALAYPQGSVDFASDRAARALTDAGLGHLVDRLTEHNDWDADLSLGDRQRLGIARLILHAPDWAMLDDCLSALDDGAGHDLLALLKTRLPGTAFVVLAHRNDQENFYTRVIGLKGATP